MVNKRRPIQILVKGIPPVKSPSIGSHKENKKRREKLKAEGLRVAIEGKCALALYNKSVKMTIMYRRFRGGIDAANIVGGIADVLQGPFYEDDKDIKEIVYIEQPDKKKDEYEVTLEAVN